MLLKSDYLGSPVFSSVLKSLLYSQPYLHSGITWEALKKYKNLLPTLSSAACALVVLEANWVFLMCKVENHCFCRKSSILEEGYGVRSQAELDLSSVT